MEESPRSLARPAEPAGTSRGPFPLLAIFGAAAILAAGSIPGPAAPLPDVPSLDKLLHVLLYAPLGAFLAWSLAAWPRRGAAGRTALVLGAGLLWGAMDEAHQAWIPGRCASVWDLAADGAGVLLGAWLAGVGTLRRHGETLRHLSWAQVLGRLRRVAERRAWGAIGSPRRQVCEERAEAVARAPRAEVPPGVRAVLERKLRLRPGGGPGALARAEAALAGRFEILGLPVGLGRPLGWTEALASASALRRFVFAYGEVLLDLVAASRATGEGRFAGGALALAREMLEARPMDASNALDDVWHPYAAGRRVAALACLAAELSGRDGVAAGRAGLASAIALHGAFLAPRLERDLRANHVLSDARGLLFAAASFEGPEASSWRARALEVLAEEVPAQVLADGGHAERSPMYQAIVLEDLLDALDLAGGESPEGRLLALAVARLATGLEALLHPDGEIAQMNDAALGVAADPRALLSECDRALAAHGLPARDPAGPRGGALPASGWWSARSIPRGDYFLLDCGPMGPDYNPGHGHADFLSYELSAGGERFVVDGGVGDYEVGPARARDRSSPAHNSVVLDGREPAELWRAFRVARRGRARLLGGGEADGLRWATASHDGFLEGSPALVHRRTVAALEGPGGSRWVVLDELLPAGADGRPLAARSLVHFHPACRVERTGSERGIAAERGATRLVFVSFSLGGGCALELGEGEHSPTFYRRTPCALAAVSVAGALPLRFGYAILAGAPGGPGGPKAIAASLSGSGAERRLAVTLDGETLSLPAPEG